MKPFRLPLRDAEVCAADAIVEFRSFLVHPIFLSSGLVALIHPSKSGRNRNVEKQREVRLESAGRKLNDLVHLFFRKPTSCALIGKGRVGVPVGDHDLAFRDRWLDQKLNVLSAVGGESEKLSHW